MRVSDHSRTNKVYSRHELPGSPVPFEKFLGWANASYQYIAFLNSANHIKDPYSGFDAILAVGATSQICPDEGKPAFDQLKNFCDTHQDWKFGFFSYDLKNQLEELTSTNPDGINMPLIHFFVPELVFIFKGNSVEIGLPQNSDLYNPGQILNEILSFEIKADHQTAISVKHRVDRAEYIKQVNRIREHIQKGDIYETNYCIEFFDDQATINPLNCFFALSSNNPAPFSCYYRYGDKYLISSSPERFLAKRGNTIVSQPIKGTIRRGNNNEEDNRLKEQLRNDPKERSENVMIVDLVRNDLSHTAEKGSVIVEELFGIYSYTHVHQMISTITSRLKPKTHYTEVIKNAFPMGSMTGAPKIRAMQIIEECEATRRGLYSGAVGYFTPDGDFDFNVVIRSILYNQTDNFISFMAGSAITIASDPEKEYQECLLKARSLARTLNSDL